MFKQQQPLFLNHKECYSVRDHRVQVEPTPQHLTSRSSESGHRARCSALPCLLVSLLDPEDGQKVHADILCTPEGAGQKVTRVQWTETSGPTVGATELSHLSQEMWLFLFNTGGWHRHTVSLVYLEAGILQTLYQKNEPGMPREYHHFFLPTTNIELLKKIRIS